MNIIKKLTILEILILLLGSSVFANAGSKINENRETCKKGHIIGSIKKCIDTCYPQGQQTVLETAESCVCDSFIEKCLSWATDANALYVGEKTLDHFNDALWAYNTGCFHEKVEWLKDQVAVIINNNFTGSFLGQTLQGSEEDKKYFRTIVKKVWQTEGPVIARSCKGKAELIQYVFNDNDAKSIAVVNKLGQYNVPGEIKNLLWHYCNKQFPGAPMVGNGQYCVDAGNFEALKMSDYEAAFSFYNYACMYGDSRGCLKMKQVGTSVSNKKFIAAAKVGSCRVQPSVCRDNNLDTYLNELMAYSTELSNICEDDVFRVSLVSDMLNPGVAATHYLKDNACNLKTQLEAKIEKERKLTQKDCDNVCIPKPVPQYEASEKQCKNPFHCD